MPILFKAFNFVVLYRRVQSMHDIINDHTILLQSTPIECDQFQRAVRPPSHFSESDTLPFQNIQVKTW